MFGVACLGLMSISYEASAVQVIHSSNRHRNSEETNELNRLEELQELLRKQVRIQQEMLDLQRQQQNKR